MKKLYSIILLAFVCTITNAQFTMLHEFTAHPDGDSPESDLVYDGTFLYGMTQLGGIGDYGMIFKIKPDGTLYSKIHDFNGSTDGKTPHGSLISDGIFLYGMTSMGGTGGNNGTIFKIKPDGTGDTVLHNFTGTPDGYNPYGSFITDGTFLYGMTPNGGANSNGTILKIKPDGTGYSKLHDFVGYPTDGNSPLGSLISDGTALYGMTISDGYMYHGSVFKFHPAGMGITENNAENDFSIYPNPTSGIFNMQMSGLADMQMKIYNLLGECIYQHIGTSSNQQIDLSFAPNGIYFLQLKTSEGTATKKLIINK